MRILSYLLCAACAGTLASCYHEIDLDKYRQEGGSDLLTLNSLVSPDSTVKVAATRPYFFSDEHNKRDVVKGLDIRLTVNGKDCGTMVFDPERQLYVSDVKSKSGDKIELSTFYRDSEVTASDVVPHAPRIESITAERQGPVHVYYDNDFIITYRITFDERPGEGDYYFLQWDMVRRLYGDPHPQGLTMGTRDFTYEFVFNKLAEEIHGTLPGWEPYSPEGLPFSDKGIDGKKHTLVLKEVIQGIERVDSRTAMERRFFLYSISKPYYDYLVSMLINCTDDKGLEGGLIDLGIADPVKVYSNIRGGLGILGSYAMAPADTIDVISLTGPFPDNY